MYRVVSIARPGILQSQHQGRSGSIAGNLGSCRLACSLQHPDRSKPNLEEIDMELALKRVGALIDRAMEQFVRAALQNARYGIARGTVSFNRIRADGDNGYSHDFWLNK